MPKRRRVLLGTVALASLTGCTGEESTPNQGATDSPTEASTDSPTDAPTEEPTEEPTDTPTEEPTETPAPAKFEFTDLSPGDTTVNYEEIVDIIVTVENTGEQEGSTEIEYRVDGEAVDTASVTLEPGESSQIEAGINTRRSEGEYEYGFFTEDSEITGTLTIQIEQPDTQSFSGSGQTVEQGIEIEGGLVVVEGSHSGESNFIVSLQGDSEYGTNFINVIGDFDGAQAELVESGTYILEVDADGSWEVDIRQPRAGGGDELPQSFSGNGPTVSGPVEFDGTHIASGEHNGDGNFQAVIYPMDGSFGEVVFNEIGEFSGETTFSFEGIGWVDVNANGQWEIDLE